jgi:hypothetical protein
MAIPFAGPCAGYGLLLAEPVGATDAVEAMAYFDGLIQVFENA